jgi:predicted nucleic acid-binding protein
MNAADVPTGPLLVDTDVFSYWYRQKGPYQAFRELAAGHELAMSFACMGEALAPVYLPGFPPKTAALIRAALGRFVILPYDVEVVERYAAMAFALRETMKGKGVNDLWTAACALSYGFPLVTNNLSDFQQVAAAFPSLVIVHPDL